VQAVPGGRGALSAAQLQWFIAGCKEDGLRPADVPASDSEARRKVEIYQLYEEQCQREGVVDFGELMLRSYELLRDNDAVREHYRRRFRHLLVDEFQDTNRLQYAWLKLIAGLPAKAVAAPSWRWATTTRASTPFAARVGNMADFVREFRCSTRSSWSRTTAATATSWMPPTR
jgi:DNA helicase-2/ATP-dependent DNA helicase PcrA